MLEASIETLHQQTNEWLNELELWIDETIFFSGYVAQLTKTQVPLKAKKVFIKINGELLNLSGGELDELKKELDAHIHGLSELLQTKPDNENEYRKTHQHLGFKIQRMETRFRELKKAIFSLVLFFRDEMSGPVNPTLSIIYNRRAVRKYKNKMVVPQLIEQILDAGRMAPSALNGQPWKFYVLTNKGLMMDLSKQITAITSKLFTSIEPSFFDRKDPIFHGAPLVIFLTVPKKNEWAHIDIGACAQNMMLATKSLGLDSCPVGLAQFAEKTSHFKNLNIPDDEQIALAITIGYADELAEMHERKRNNVVYIR